MAVSVAAVARMVLFVIWHNVSLQGRLDQARADERQARQREPNAIEVQRLSQVQNAGQKIDFARPNVSLLAARSLSRAQRLELAQRRAARVLNPWVVAMREPGGLVPTGVAGNSAGLVVANGRVGGRESS